ncbi:hypothetical protein QAD02_023550 [Eretmocerus hayati]|uniref:Uncharacterized protein n=1 Tax=Eretmocerus hayati TaxID=131215 RepID=A0ACC2PW51_9HYME|nr:hypothetical protein QAD02_023550 [Eretmocerus hayati]
MEDIESFLKNLGVGRRPSNDTFLNSSHEFCKVFERKGISVEDDEELCHEVMREFPCNACPATFQNLLDYELHYHNTHHFVCTECKKWRPTARLLEIHVLEVHDSFFKVLSEKQPMYQCFVSECKMKFNNSNERREHCQSIHQFPKSYRFDDAIKSSCQITQMETDDGQSKVQKNQKISFGVHTRQKAFSKQNFKLREPVKFDSSGSGPSEKVSPSPATMFIPRQVLQKNQQIKRNALESESMMELGNSLPDT